MPHLTVVLPAKNEAEGIVEGLKRLEQVLVTHDLDAEILVIDDSDDETPARVRNTVIGVPLRLIHRSPGERNGGLSSAVVHGFLRAESPFVLVMDSDMQHPPESIPAMLNLAEAGAEVIVGSRYRPGGTASGLDGPVRKLVSYLARYAAKGLFPNRLRGITDPLSGFFLVNREVISAATLRPTGFKILLEVLTRASWRTCSELPFVFEPRRAGTSKATIAQGRAFLAQLAHLQVDRMRGQIVNGHERPPHVLVPDAEPRQGTPDGVE